MLGNNGICMCVGINKEMFGNLNPLTKNYLRNKCGQEIKQIFGGSYEYEKSRVKLFGFKGVKEYKKDLANRNGFATRWEMEKATILKKFKTIRKYFDEKAKEKGFKDYRDYQDFLFRNLGFKDFNDYQRFRYKELMKFRDENSLCMRCQNKRDSKFKTCSKCRGHNKNWNRKRRILKIKNDFEFKTISKQF